MKDAEFSILSSVREDVWHPNESNAAAYEWWYFDALSRDGRDALVIIFLDNFIFSPRYNSRAQRNDNERLRFIKIETAHAPAVAFCFYRDGRPLFRAINEYSHEVFHASADHPSCRINRSAFELREDDNASSERGNIASHKTYALALDEPLRGARHLRAELAWTILDGDFDERATANLSSDAARRASAKESVHDQIIAHEWNMVAPRCKVNGEIRIEDARGRPVFQNHFAGVGYHDHNRDSRPMPRAIKTWQWGRAHFDNETTAIFYRYRPRNAPQSITKLFVVRDGALQIHEVECSERKFRRDIFGLRCPRNLSFDAKTSGECVTLSISQRRAIDRSFFYLRFLSDAELRIENGSALRTVALTEHLAPRSLRWRWLDWLVNMRIGRDGRAAFLP